MSNYNMIAERKVSAINNVMASTNLIAMDLATQLEKLIGKKIFTVDGSLYKNVDVVLLKPELVSFDADGYDRLDIISFRCDHQRYARLKVRGCFKRDGVSCFYEEMEINVATVSDGRIESICIDEDFTPITVAEQLAMKEELVAIEQRSRDLKRKIRI
jgi:hypothetical protein